MVVKLLDKTWRKCCYFDFLFNNYFKMKAIILTIDKYIKMVEP